MADNNNTNANNIDFSSLYQDNRTEQDYLRSIDRRLKDLTSQLSNMSQSSAQDRRNNTSDQNWRNAGKADAQQARRRLQNSQKDFLDGIDEAVSQALGLSDMQKRLEKAADEFADALGANIKDMPYKLGKKSTEYAISIFESVPGVKPLADQLTKSRNAYFEEALKYQKNATERIKAQREKAELEAKKQQIAAEKSEFAKAFSSEKGTKGYNKALDEYDDQLSDIEKKIAGIKKPGNIGFKGLKDVFTSDMSSWKDFAYNAKSTIGSNFMSGYGLVGDLSNGAGKELLAKFAPDIADAVSGGLSGLLSASGGPVGLAITAGVEVITSTIDATLGKSLENVAEDFDKLMKGLATTVNRGADSARKATEEGNKRLRADIETLIREPFEILKKSAQEVYDAWDSNVRLINQTQGYSKTDLMNLMESYSSRLKSEGLTSEIDAANITNNLAKVLQSGLQGDVATEFAYEATKLNAAIPTQDFFQYASTYASLAANAVKDGMSQSEAIKYATQQLDLFASDIAYASRQLTGGFSSGLSAASDLFQKAVQISVAAKTNNPSNLAGTLTSVSAIVGAVAPDLTSSIVDAVYNAAVGGNSSQIVALRSLAGINASNTEFLKEFANNPQGVLYDIFSKLGSMQKMSSSNYMEVAEGLSNVFGISSDALSRVDFNYLADAVKSMKVNNSSLQENISLLKSGQSTTNADQMKMDQVNKYILDEGLTYVLDNEAGRAIQEHMWDEQENIKLMQNTYGVELRGQALSLLTSIGSTIQTILGFLNPFSSYNPLTNLIKTTVEAATADDSVKAVLEAGKIGSGNQEVLSNLTTYGKDLNLTNSYLSMIQKAVSGQPTKYEWGELAKSAYKSLGTSATGAQISSSSSINNANYSKTINLQRMGSSFSRMLGTMSNFFTSTVDDKVQNAIKQETSRLASNYVNKISKSAISKTVDEYIANPEKYGIGDIIYSSKLAGASKASGLSGFNEEVQARSRQLVEQKVISDLTEKAKQDAKAQAYQNVITKADSGYYGSTGYNAWAASASKYGISDLASVMDELGYTEADVQNYFNTLDAQYGQRAIQEREKTEEEFWQNVQDLLTLSNSYVHDVFDKGDVMGIFWPGIDSWLSDIDSTGTSGGKTVGGSGFRGEMNEWFYQTDADINSFHTEMITQFKGFRKDWTDFYINHTTYTQHLTGTSDGESLLNQLDEVKSKKGKTTEDVINTLSDALMKNNIGDLLDPTVQTNVFLASILQAVQTIVQQNNTQGKLKLPDAISALATGMTVSTNTKTNA